jgi:hypothetical protein
MTAWLKNVQFEISIIINHMVSRADLPRRRRGAAGATPHPAIT